MKRLFKICAAALLAVCVCALPIAQAVAAGAWVQEDDGANWYYRDQDGKPLRSQWLELGGLRYYFGSDGAMRTGWLRQTGPTGKPVWYYLHSPGGNGVLGSMATGWQRGLPGSALRGKSAGSCWYYFNANGAMRTGWVKPKGAGLSEWYYMKADGSMATGWVKVDGFWYYARTAKDTPAPGKEGAILQGGSWEIAGKAYTFDATGRYI